MAVVIIGGGLAGCAAAKELASSGMEVVILEKSSVLGGKVVKYGCKASDVCNNCGLCITSGLFDSVKENGHINISYNSELVDISGRKGCFNIIYKTPEGVFSMSDVDAVIVAAGFEEFSRLSSGCIESAPDNRIISGMQLENIFSQRGLDSVGIGDLNNIAFIQCFGSRDIKEKATYCSRVCCGYSTRAAKVFKYCYPKVNITFFYMDLQRVRGNDYFEVLNKEGIRFVRSRPVKIEHGKLPLIIYEEPGKSGLVREEFDLVVLSEGIHPSADTERLAEICGLGINKNGFLKYVEAPDITGIYLAGCVSGPLRIEETYTQAVNAARELMEGRVLI
jgi:heterodisulfide reductase subunit A2